MRWYADWIFLALVIGGVVSLGLSSLCFVGAWRGVHENAAFNGIMWLVVAYGFGMFAFVRSAVF